MPDRENIRFNTLRNALYHTGRRRSFERLNRFCNFTLVLLGAAVVGDLAARYGVEALWPGVAVACISAVQLVLDFGGRARDHQLLQREYFNLLAEIEQVISATDDQCAEWYSRMIRITADEPPVLRALDAKAFNDAMDATGLYDREDRLLVPFRHCLVACFLAFDGYTYKTFREHADEAERKRAGKGSKQPA
tara:strand:- start:30 stop:605 length:576 start_codon:yes stop_codon:yes gene_type:complete